MNTNSKQRVKETKSLRKRKAADSNNKSVKLRKGQESLDHMAILSDYAEGVMSVSEIAKAHKTSDENVGLIASRFWKQLTNVREARLLAEDAKSAKEHFATKSALSDLERTKDFNKDFKALLSDSSSALLTDEEAIYCWTYVHTGDTMDAIRQAGLDIGLFKENNKSTRFAYDRSMKLRAMYLNAKPNVVAYIKELRESRLIDADVGKARIQSELLEQLDQMKSSGEPNRLRTQILKTIELLGKTVGAFTERVEIHEVDPANALDKLIEMAQEAQVQELTEEKQDAITQ